MGLLDFLGLGNKSENIAEFMKNGAVIIDVRSVGEFQGGHIKGSKNIPLNTIGNKINEIKNDSIPPVVTTESKTEEQSPEEKELEAMYSDLKGKI